MSVIPVLSVASQDMPKIVMWYRSPMRLPLQRPAKVLLVHEESPLGTTGTVSQAALISERFLKP